MKRRFILYRRKRGGMFYVEDTETLDTLLRITGALEIYSAEIICQAQSSFNNKSR